jgi:hypothetical protein
MQHRNETVSLLRHNETRGAYLQCVISRNTTVNEIVIIGTSVAIIKSNTTFGFCCPGGEAEVELIQISRSIVWSNPDNPDRPARNGFFYCPFYI